MSEATDGSSKSVDGTGQRATDLPADAPWWARWIVANYRDWFKWLSQWFFVALGIVPVLRENSDWFQAHLSAPQFHYLMTALAVLGFISRFINQTRKE